MEIDWKKKYEEALERARALREEAIEKEYVNDYVKDYEAIFPELAESEDEKIRTFLYEFIKVCGWSDKQYPPREKCLDYLEKQKEQKPKITVKIPKFRVGDIIQHVPLESWDRTKKIKAIDKDGYYTDASHLGDNVSGGFIGFSFEDEYELVKQKPQIFIPKFRVGDKVISTKNEHLTYNVLEVGHINELGNPDYKVEIFTDGKADNNVKFIECQKMDEWGKLIEQKPAEWDDYTKTNLNRALQIIRNAKGTLRGYQSDDGIYECDKAIECLEHFLYRGLEIENPAEWSEEDEEIFNNIIEKAKGGHWIEVNEITWLINSFKSLRLKPHWKPSDEQMGLFGRIVNDLKIKMVGVTIKEHHTLDLLYNDLKKLM